MRPVLTLLLALSASPLVAQEDFASWPVITDPFASTGGGGIMIGGYRPVVVGTTCTTDFTAIEPNGTVHRNSVVFRATPTAGGTLCDEGRWRSADGSATGTTPFRVFLRDGIARGNPM